MIGSNHVDISALPDLTLDQVSKITGFKIKDLAEEIKKSGVWRIVAGSRGYLEDIEYIGPITNNTLCFPSLEEVIAKRVKDGHFDSTDFVDDEEKRNYIADTVDELYGVDQETFAEAVIFNNGCSDEEEEYYVKVKVEK